MSNLENYSLTFGLDMIPSFKAVSDANNRLLIRFDLVFEVQIAILSADMTLVRARVLPATPSGTTLLLLGTALVVRYISTTLIFDDVQITFVSFYNYSRNKISFKL